MGLQNIPLKAASTLKSAILAACLSAGGFSATIAVEDATEGMKSAICTALMVVPAVLLVAGALILIVGFRLTKDNLEQMQIEIERRKEEENLG